MPASCPYCDHALALKNARPGRFTAACPKWRRKFLLVVPTDPALSAVVAPIKGQRARGETLPGPTEEFTVGARDPGASPLPSAPATDPAVGSWTAPPAPPPLMGRVPKRLGGYRIVEELGRGGMGAVYLARRFATGRTVALRVMRPDWASDPTFVARFTREAYAAAQLSHPNLLPIDDFGEDQGLTYFSTEYVEGETLAGLVRRRRRLGPEEAAGYVLQAARGLKHAHDQGLVHRDVKPANLLVSGDGVVKVADLGLVKTPGSAEADEAAAGRTAPRAGRNPTQAAASAALRTPASMAPEQAGDAALSDAWADIDSLGCILYDLLTGRPPFEGGSAREVIARHQTEPVTPPDRVVEGVPKALSEILRRMLAKRPEDRYPNLGAVIADLEGFLGVGAFSAAEGQAEVVRAAAEEFHAAPSARLRARVVPLALAGGLALALLGLVNRRFLLGGALLGFTLLTALADFVVGGVRRKSYWFARARALALGSSPSEGLTALAAVALLGAALYAFNLAFAWLFLGAAAVCLALAADVALDRKAEAERAGALETARSLLRSLRLQGLDEDALRRFVWRAGGDHVEEFFEALFGYEALVEARRRVGHEPDAPRKPRHAPWRDPLVAWIDARQQARAEARAVRHLQKVEEKALQAQGENLVSARRKAQRAAEAMVAVATDLKRSQAITRRDGTLTVNHDIARAMSEAARKPEDVLVHRETGLVRPRSPDRIGPLIDAVVGPRPRFLLGAALLAGCLFWMKQNDMLAADRARAVVSAARAGDLEAIRAEVRTAADRARRVLAPRDLRAPVVPPRVLKLVSGFGSGVAGLFLIVSAFVGGSRIALFALPAAALALLGPRVGLPSVPGLDPSAAPAALGAGVLVLGLLFGRGRR